MRFSTLAAYCQTQQALSHRSLLFAGNQHVLFKWLFLFASCSRTPLALQPNRSQASCFQRGAGGGGGLKMIVPLPADWLNRLAVYTGATTWPWGSLKNYRLKLYVICIFSMFSKNTLVGFWRYLDNSWILVDWDTLGFFGVFVKSGRSRYISVGLFSGLFSGYSNFKK